MQPVIGTFCFGITFIFVYSAFKSLKISRVLPWLIVVAVLNVGYSVFTVYQTEELISDPLYIVPSYYALLSIVLMLIAVYGINLYFRIAQPERY